MLSFCFFIDLFSALFLRSSSALPRKNERCSFGARNLKNERHSPRVREIESGAQSGAHQRSDYYQGDGYSRTLARCEKFKAINIIFKSIK